jgi:serine protease inhibitor
MKKFKLILIIVAVFFSSCNKENQEYISTIDFSNDKKAAWLIQSDNEFAFDLMDEVLKNEELENFMISPLSVSMALGMTYNGSDGDTKTAFEQTLGLNGFTRSEINYIHGVLLNHLIKVDPKVTMKIANSIWLNDLFSYQTAFADTNRYYYQAQINTLDFSSPSSLDVINNWVDDKTNGKITEVLNEIPSKAVMYLINALYFYGNWTYQFEEKENFKISFNYDDGSRDMVDGMTVTTDLLMYQNKAFKMIELPYGDEKYSMLILIPEEGYHVKDISNMLDNESYKDYVSNIHKVNGVELQMPKFKYEYKTILNDPLIDMGLGVAFTENAEFPLMINETSDLAISRVIHKTYIDVNEKGTEAAAVTAIEMVLTSVGEEEIVKVDKPFLYIIREKTSNAIVFMGKVGNPEYKD